MRKFYLQCALKSIYVFCILGLGSIAYAALISRQTTFTDGQVLTHSQLNNEYDEVFDEINGNLNAANLAATLTFADGDFIDLSAINMSSTTEGLKLGAATSCSSATAEGQICWDTDDDRLVLGDGATVKTLYPSDQATLTTSSPTFVDLTLTGSGSDLSLQHTGSDTFGLHTEANSLLYLKNETDNAYYLLIGGDHTQYYGTSGGSDSLTPAHIFQATTTGNDAFRIPSGGISLTTEVSGTLPVANGGTGATVASTALTNLGGIGAATTDTLTNKTLAAADNVIDADTAVALAANGANCSAGQYPLGVDASGAAESCTAAAAGGSFFVGVFTKVTSDASATQSITGVGFQPTAVQFWCADNAANADRKFMGASTATVDGYLFSPDSTTDNPALWENTTVIGLYVETASNYYYATAMTPTSDGFDLAWVKTGSPTTTISCKYLAMK